MAARPTPAAVPGARPQWLAALACLCLGVAQAQVVRCTDARTGRVTYTNGSCIAGERGVEVQPAQTAAEIARERAQAEAATARSREQAAYYEAERTKREERERKEFESWQREQARLRASQPAVQPQAPPAADSGLAYYGNQPYYGSRPYHHGAGYPGYNGYGGDIRPQQPPGGEHGSRPPENRNTMSRGKPTANAPARSISSTGRSSSHDR